jgi:restriction system protein
VDAFERDFLERDPEVVAKFCTLVLDFSVYPEGFAHRTRALYRPDPREVAVEYELPPQSVVPAERDYKYVATRDEIDTLTRPEKEIKDRYARLIAQVAIRTIHEVLISVPPEVASVVTFYGHVSTTDMATGQPIRPCLISASAERVAFRGNRYAILGHAGIQGRRSRRCGRQRRSLHGRALSVFHPDSAWSGLFVTG